MDTSSQNNDKIADSLQLAPLQELVPAVINDDLDKVDNDYDYARGNLIAAIEKGQEALSGVVDVAERSQHPRSYEVVATLVTAVSNASKDLLELSKKKKELTGSSSGPTTVNNNLFVGSTAELLKLLKDNK